jgi:predicted MPP superfamily phosphohydrolase
MRLTVLHLSDIHFKRANDPIVSRKESIAAAVRSLDPSPDAILIVVSGDVAFSGSPGEYAVAKGFFNDLMKIIQEVAKTADIVLVSVPGNHDCYIPKGEEGLRKSLIDGILPTIETACPDQSILKQVLKAQRGYFRFAKHYATASGGVKPWLHSTQVLNTEGVNVHVNLYNTSVLSQNPEIQGSLKVPIGVLERDVHAPTDSSFVISVIHHSYIWLESNNAVRFRTHIDNSSDLILSGHQHIEDAYVKEAFSGARATYLEGAALQDESTPTTSGFNIVQCDFSESRQRTVHFDWRKDGYFPVGESNWTPVIANRAFRHGFTISEQFRQFLTDPGAGYTHARKPQLNLRDIYVYPDLLVRTTDPNSQPRDVAPGRLQEYLRNSRYVIFEGPARSGRSALAKILFEDFLAAGFVPLFVDGGSVKFRTAENLINRLWASAKEQYSPQVEERFKQLSPALRVLIVDDWHRAPLSPEGRATFLSTAKHHFGKVLLFSEPLFNIREFVTKSADETTMVHFDRATLPQFGYKARGKLIEKWLTLGRELSYDRKTLIHEIDEVENTVTTLLGKNTLPKFPFIVLSVLQAYQEKATTRPEAGSYGYVYEVLITTALGTTAKSPSDIDKKYTLLCRLAYDMFKREVDSVSHDEIVTIIENYFRAYGLSLATDQMMGDLLKAGVISVVEGTYRFSYDYYSEYFVARYYKDALQREDGKETAFGEVCNIADQIYYDRFARIIMFLLYFSKNEALISRLVAAANKIFEEYPPAELSFDIDFANGLYKGPPIRDLPQKDVGTYREERRESLDRMEKQYPNDEGKMVQYSKNLADSIRFGIAIKHLELLGQILRNFPGSLIAAKKMDIAECTYMLGLRAMSVLIRLIESSVGQYRRKIAGLLQEERKGQEGGLEGGRTASERPEPCAATLKEFRDLADSVCLLLTRIFVIGLIKVVSFAVGSNELDQTYSDVLNTVPDSLAVKFIDLTIRLDHFRGFPKAKVEQLLRRVEKSLFLHDVLSELVIYHLMLFEVDREIRDSMASQLGFHSSHPKLIGQDRKLLRSKEIGG